MSDRRSVRDVAGVPSHADQGRISQLEQHCADLARENERLHAELAAARTERDDYLKALYACLPPEQFEFTKEEVFASRGKEPPLQAVIAQLEHGTPD